MTTTGIRVDGDYRFASLRLFTYAQSFFVMSLGLTGLLPKTASIVSVHPLKLMEYPPNAAFFVAIHPLLSGPTEREPTKKPAPYRAKAPLQYQVGVLCQSFFTPKAQYLGLERPSPARYWGGKCQSFD